MRIAVLVARLLLGFVFLFFGLNGFFQFLPMKEPTGPAGQFLGALFVTHELTVIFALQIIGGVLLLAGQFVPLGLVILGPIVVNILFFHAFMEPSGLSIALVVVILWLVVFAGFRDSFAGIFQQKPPVRP